MWQWLKTTCASSLYSSCAASERGLRRATSSDNTELWDITQNKLINQSCEEISVQVIYRLAAHVLFYIQYKEEYSNRKIVNHRSAVRKASAKSINNKYNWIYKGQ